MLRELSERVSKFERFNRDYSDYKRFRDRIRKQGINLKPGTLDSRFTTSFIKRLIEESKNLCLSKDSTEDFDENLLIEDLKTYEEWKQNASDLLFTLEDDELALNDKEMIHRFEDLKK